MSVSQVLSASCLSPHNFTRQTSVAREFLRVIQLSAWPQLHPKIAEDERSKTKVVCQIVTKALYETCDKQHRHWLTFLYFISSL